ncbi:MAG: ATP-binding protein [Phycisphaerales bacterium]|nr:ATP-binding protein [Phycisphaerales bacterium]
MIIGISLLVGMLIGGFIAYLLAARRVRLSILREHNAKRRANAAEHLAEVGSMTGGLAHEIKNPLSTIGLNAQLLAEAIEDLSIEDQEQVRLVRRCDALRRETERLRGILEDFLEYAGELHLSKKATNLNRLIEELADFFSPMVDGANVRMRIESAEDLSTLHIDADHLKQALLNLMLNAIHAMENTDSTQRELILRVEQDTDFDLGNVVRVHVIDTGPGLDQETQGKVFHPYFTTKSGGTGLGLPTARRIVEAHHGRLELHSEVGKGTDFVILLPISENTMNESI